MNSENRKMLKIIEYNLIIETESRGIRSKSCKNDSGTRLWTENTRKTLNDRRASVHNEEKAKLTEHKTIMEHSM